MVPATIAVLDGRLKAGLTDEELVRIAGEDIAKLSVRDLPIALARAGSGATTVAATSYIANLAGIRVFATGGLGGVHRGAAETFDESADLTVLSEVPITVVSAGVKSILDIPATLERLESLSVIVLGYGTNAVAEVMASRDALGQHAAILVANPLPEAEQLDPAMHDQALTEALRMAEAQGLSGKQVTPFLLLTIVELTGGKSLAVNLKIAENNIRVAGQIALSWTAR